jgi:hypothetical protein
MHRLAAAFAIGSLPFVTSAPTRAYDAPAEPESSASYTCHLGEHRVGVTLDVHGMTMTVDEERWYGARPVGRDTLTGPALRYEDDTAVAYEMPTDLASGFYYLWFPRQSSDVLFAYCWGCIPYVCTAR